MKPGGRTGKYAEGPWTQQLAVTVTLWQGN